MGMVPPRPLLPMGVVSVGEVRKKMDLPPMGRLRESVADLPALSKAAADLCEEYGTDSVEEALDLAFKQATRATWGVTMQEAANALMSMLGGNRDKPGMHHFKDATNRPVFIEQDEIRPGQYEDAVVDYERC